MHSRIRCVPQLFTNTVQGRVLNNQTKQGTRVKTLMISNGHECKKTDTVIWSLAFITKIALVASSSATGLQLLHNLICINFPSWKKKNRFSKRIKNFPWKFKRASLCLLFKQIYFSKLQMFLILEHSGVSCVGAIPAGGSHQSVLTAVGFVM